MQVKHTQSFSDKGILNAIEGFKVPFVINRIFWVYEVPEGQIRGKHAHLKCDQYFICMKGVIIVNLIYENGYKQKYTLTEGMILSVPHMTYAEEQYMTGNDLLVVLCSHDFDDKDYINLNEFLQLNDLL